MKYRKNKPSYGQSERVITKGVSAPRSLSKWKLLDFTRGRPTQHSFCTVRMRKCAIDYRTLFSFPHLKDHGESWRFTCLVQAESLPCYKAERCRLYLERKRTRAHNSRIHLALRDMFLKLAVTLSPSKPCLYVDLKEVRYSISSGFQ